MLVGIFGCAPVEAEPESPPVEPAPVAEPAPEDVPAPAEPEPAPATDSPATWFEPLPALDLSTGDDAQKASAHECMERHRVQQPDVTAGELLAAAKCMGDIPLVGHEIRLYKHLLQTHPNAPEVQEAARGAASRYEQIGIYDQAIDLQVWYLEHWPKADDARALGQRAVCLAHALGTNDRRDEILAKLQRYYARTGFEAPNDESLDVLCANVPTARSVRPAAEASP
jgi:hypothetical protein